MYYRYKDLHQAVNNKKSGENEKAKEAPDGRVLFHDASHEMEIKTRAQVRQRFWAIHLKSRYSRIGK